MLIKYLSWELICFGNVFRKTWIKTAWEWYLSFHQAKKSPTEEQHEILYEMSLYSTYWIHISIGNKNALEKREFRRTTHAERTRLLRMFCPRSFTHFPWGVQLFLWPSASPNKRQVWVTAYLIMKGPQETSLPETPTATHPSTCLPHWQWLPSDAHQAHLLSQRNLQMWQKSISAHLPGSLIPCHAPNDLQISSEAKMEKGQWISIHSRRTQ